MPMGLRERLPSTAHAAGTDLVIDESFVDLNLDGVPMPPTVACFDRTARVLTIGGMSKPYWGGLRIGWIRAAAPLVARLAAARVGVDMASPVLDQLVAARLLAHRHTVIEARRKLVAARRDALVDALRTELPEWRFTVPSGGLSMWVELDAPVSSALARAVDELGVRVAPGSAVRRRRDDGAVLPAAVRAARGGPARGGSPAGAGARRSGPAEAARVVVTRGRRLASWPT